MKLIYIIALLTFISWQGHAQCVREISTNPNNAYNLEWQSQFQNDNGSFINTGFSWYLGSSIVIDRSQNWTDAFIGITSPVVNMYWPFANSNGEHTFYLNTQIDPETLEDEYPKGMIIPEENRDFHWEDGWELLYLNVGKLPNGELTTQKDINAWDPAPEQPNPSWVPYFVLYNRYRGTLRVFFNAWINNEKYDNVNVSLRFAEGSDYYNTMSGVFRHASGIDQALDQKTKVEGLSAPKNGSGNSINYNQWFVADFQLGYDVCQCVIPSRMVLVFEARNEITAELFSRHVSLEQSIFNDLGLDKNFFQTMVDEDGEYAIPGNVIFNSFDELTKSYNEAMSAYTDYMSQENQIKIAIASAGNAAILGGLSKVFVPTNHVKDFLLNTQIKVNGNSVFGPKDETEAGAWAGKLQAGLKSILGSELDFFSGVLDIAPKASAPQVPVATFTEGVINGKLNEIDAAETVPLFLPGAITPDLSIKSHEFPVYNNVLGLFAMLRTPNVQLFSNEALLNDYTHVNGYPNHKKGKHINKHTLALQLNKLSYAFNPAVDLDMSKTTLNGAILITFKSKEKHDILIDPHRRFDKKFSNFEINHQYIDDEGYLITEYMSNYYQLSEISNVLFQLNLNIEGDYEWYDHNYEGFYIGSPRKDIEHNLISIKFRVLTDMYFDQIGSNGAQVNNFQVFTYELYDRNVDLGDIKTAVEGDKGEILDDWTGLVNHHGHVVLDGIVKPTDNEVWEVIGNEIIVKAENVTIKENVKPQEGYVLKILHSGSVDMNPNADLFPNTETILTQFYNNEPNAITKVDDNFIRSYCDNDYKANISALTKNQMDNAVGTAGNRTFSDVLNLKASIYPNPVNNEVNVKITQGKFDNCTVSVYSLAGQMLIHEKVAENLLNGFAIETSALTNGYYILELRSSTGQVIREQFVVQH